MYRIDSPEFFIIVKMYGQFVLAKGGNLRGFSTEELIQNVLSKRFHDGIPK